MRKVCSHPALVLDQANAAHQRALATQQLSLPLKDGPLHAPKLGALRELLGQCGIGSLGDPCSTFAVNRFLYPQISRQSDVT